LRYLSEVYPTNSTPAQSFNEWFERAFLYREQYGAVEKDESAWGPDRVCYYNVFDLRRTVRVLIEAARKIQQQLGEAALPTSPQSSDASAQEPLSAEVVTHPDVEAAKSQTRTPKQILKGYIKDNDLTVRKLARKCGINETVIYRIQKGDLSRCSEETLDRIAKHVGVPVEQLKQTPAQLLSRRKSFRKS
jgi:plasmid maintenance system antidote protein VapI